MARTARLRATRRWPTLLLILLLPLQMAWAAVEARLPGTAAHAAFVQPVAGADTHDHGHAHAHDHAPGAGDIAHPTGDTPCPESDHCHCHAHAVGLVGPLAGLPVPLAGRAAPRPPEPPALTPAATRPERPQWAGLA